MKLFLLLAAGIMVLAGCSTVGSTGAGGTGSGSESIDSAASGPNMPGPHIAPGDSTTRAFPNGGGGGVTSTGAH